MEFEAMKGLFTTDKNEIPASYRHFDRLNRVA
jgi:hypothetical protein